MSELYIVKNALRCISRSKGRNILIGIIVLVISVSACIGLAIRQAAQSTREDTLSQMSVTATISFDRQSMMSDMTGGEKFDKSQFSQMMGNASALTLDEYILYSEAESVNDFYYTATISLDGTEGIEAVTSEASSDTEDNAEDAFPGGRGGKINEMMGGASGDFSLTGYSSETAMTSFIDGTAAVTDGSVFEEGGSENDCIISEELAAYNSLEVGDVFSLANPGNSEETYDFTITGIYSDSSSNQGFETMMGNSFSDPANRIYLSSAALISLTDASKESSVTVTDETTGQETETALTPVISATYVFDDTDSYYRFEDEVREMGLSDSYSVSSQDITSFESSLVPLDTLSTMAGWFLLVLLIIGAVILVVLNIFNVRERKYEIGVLTAMGMKKRCVAMQFLCEIFAVTLASVIIGLTIGAVSALPVANALLENQISSSEAQNTQTEKNFGRGEPGAAVPGDIPDDNAQPPEIVKTGFMDNIFGGRAADYISEINSAMNFTVVLQMLGIAVLLTLVSGAVSMLFVMRYEPLKILANRD